MTATDLTLAVVGTAYHTPTVGSLEVLDDVVIGVDGEGVIVDIARTGTAAAAAILSGATVVHELSPTQRVLPGFVDLHIHAPQWPQLGTGLDLPLERWLFEYTFPLEARFADTEFAREVWAHMVPTLLAHGTTTAVYFGSVHEEATLALAAQCVRSGQRAFVGRVAMDHPEGTPEWYRDASAADGIAASRRSVEAIRALGDPRVQPIVTPRFIPACTDELLVGLADVAATTGALVQTHCSESDWEHGYVIDRHGCSDTESLRRFGLLRAGTVLAHGNHLGRSDMAAIRAARSGVAHCPLSNSFFANAALPLRLLLDEGVPVGLGTDIAGGPEPSLLRQCSHAVTTSRMLEDGVDAARPAHERGVPGSRIDAITALFVATAGGAEVLGVPVGRFVPGCRFDAVAVDTNGSTALRNWDGIDDHERLVEKIVHVATRADIARVWVDGRTVVG